VATQGQNVLRGSRMVFNTRTGQGHMEGAAKGRNKVDRPRGVFYPKSSNTPAASKR
jgi:lipopolysaccharide export system protein LptA